MVRKNPVECNKSTTTFLESLYVSVWLVLIFYIFYPFRYAWKGKYDKLQQYLWHKEKHFKANKVDKYDRYHILSRFFDTFLF